MYFTLSSNENPYSLDLKYEYFTTELEAQTKLGLNYIPKYSVSSKPVSSYSNLGSGQTYSIYFTIKKKSNELGGSNGDFLLLYYNFDGEIKFENTESSGTKKITIIVIVVFSVFFVVFVVIIVVCCCRRRRSLYANAQSSFPFMPMYGQSPMYVQGPGYPQGQMLVQPQGQMIVQPQGQMIAQPQGQMIAHPQGQMIAQQRQINPQNGNNVLLYPQQVVVANNNQVAAPYNNVNKQKIPNVNNNRVNMQQSPGGQTTKSNDYLNEKYK